MTIKPNRVRLVESWLTQNSRICEQGNITNPYCFFVTSVVFLYIWLHQVWFQTLQGVSHSAPRMCKWGNSTTSVPNFHKSIPWDDNIRWKPVCWITRRHSISIVREPRFEKGKEGEWTEQTRKGSLSNGGQLRQMTLNKSVPLSPQNRVALSPHWNSFSLRLMETITDIRDWSKWEDNCPWDAHLCVIHLQYNPDAYGSGKTMEPGSTRTVRARGLGEKLWDKVFSIWHSASPQSLNTIVA